MFRCEIPDFMLCHALCTEIIKECYPQMSLVLVIYKYIVEFQCYIFTTVVTVPMNKKLSSMIYEMDMNFNNYKIHLNFEV